jgi:hypothetical protein
VNITRDGSPMPPISPRGPIKQACRLCTAAAMAASTYLAGTRTANAASYNSVVAAGDTPPTLTLTGTPTGPFSFRLEITTGGSRGTAVFRWSSDGGTTYTSGVTTGATNVLGSTGVTANWAVGTYSNTNVYTETGEYVAMATVDGVAPAVGDRILDKDHATASTRGIYEVISLGSTTTPWVMRRASDADTTDKMVPEFLVGIAEGTANGDKTACLTTDAAITLDSTSLSFALASADAVSSSRTITATAPIQIDGDNAAHDLSANRTFSIAAATTVAAGSMSAADKALLDELAADAVPEYKLAVRAAAQGNLAGTRSGNVITLTALAVLLKATVDSGWSGGAALAVGDRLLLPSQTSSVDNGIYVITTLGTVGVAGATLTRASDANTSALITSEMRVPVSEGTDANVGYLLAVANPITLNTTGLTFTKDNLSAVANPIIGDGSGQANFRGGAKVAAAPYAGHSTRTGLVTDYIVPITDTTAAVIYQAVAMGATSTQRIPLIIKDESYGDSHATAQGSALGHTITFKPVSGKKLNNVVDGTLVILNAGGVISVEIDENDNVHQLGFTP